MEKRVKIISGFQPTGRLTLGNYLGAIKPALTLQQDNDLYIFIADLHSLTLPIDAAILSEYRHRLLDTFERSGLTGKRTRIFFQSDLPQHTYLSYLLTTQTTIGELSRMTQFKDKSQRQQNNSVSIPTGLLVYPVLMAADILVHNSDKVVVGNDQKQHLELARNIAQRFNKRYGETFVIPEPHINSQTGRIMSLTEPTKKMSKSDTRSSSTIFLDEDPEEAYQKIMNAVTDSENSVYISDKKPGITNLINILAALEDREPESVAEECKRLNYRDFKQRVAESVRDFLISFQGRQTGILRANYPKLIAELRQETDAVIELVRRRMGIERCDN